MLIPTKWRGLLKRYPTFSNGWKEAWHKHAIDRLIGEDIILQGNRKCVILNPVWEYCIVIKEFPARALGAELKIAFTFVSMFRYTKFVAEKDLS
jgi:hypothetical protein